MVKTYSMGPLFSNEHFIGTHYIRGGRKYCRITIDLSSDTILPEEGQKLMNKLLIDYVENTPNPVAHNPLKKYNTCGGGFPHVQTILVLVRDWRDVFSKMLDIIKEHGKTWAGLNRFKDEGRLVESIEVRRR